MINAKGIFYKLKPEFLSISLEGKVLIRKAHSNDQVKETCAELVESIDMFIDTYGL